MRKLTWILCFPLLAGCTGGISWAEYEFPKSLTPDEAWTMVHTCANACRLPVDQRNSNEEDGEFVSIWDKRLMHFGKGFRRRLILRYLEREEDQVKSLRYYVERQRNGSMERTLNPEASDWEDTGQDRKTELLFQTHLDRRFFSKYRHDRDGKKKKQEQPDVFYR